MRYDIFFVLIVFMLLVITVMSVSFIVLMRRQIRQNQEIQNALYRLIEITKNKEDTY